MNDAIAEKKKAARGDYWQEQIAQQSQSGQSVQQFCKTRGITEQSFYVWRKRLQKREPVRFALVETGPAQQGPVAETGLELVLTSGERLRIGKDVELALLRRVLEVLRA
jgi:transposase-like protein